MLLFVWNILVTGLLLWQRLSITAVSVSFRLGRIPRITLKPSASWVVYLEMSHGVRQYFDGMHFAVNMTLEALPKINCRKQKWNITDAESAHTCLVLCDKWRKMEKWPHWVLWRDHIHSPKGFFFCFSFFRWSPEVNLHIAFQSNFLRWWTVPPTVSTHGGHGPWDPTIHNALSGKSPLYLIFQNPVGSS